MFPLARFPDSGPPAYPNGFIVLIWSLHVPNESRLPKFLIFSWTLYLQFDLLTVTIGYCLNILVSPKQQSFHGYSLRAEGILPSHVPWNYGDCLTHIKSLIGENAKTQWKQRRVRVSLQLLFLKCLQFQRISMPTWHVLDSHILASLSLSLYICISTLMLWIINS